MENNQEKKTVQTEKQTRLEDETVLEMINGGLILRNDGTYYCPRCGKSVSCDHICAGKKTIVL